MSTENDVHITFYAARNGRGWFKDGGHFSKGRPKFFDTLGGIKQSLRRYYTVSKDALQVALDWSSVEIVRFDCALNPDFREPVKVEIEQEGDRFEVCLKPTLESEKKKGKKK